MLFDLEPLDVDVGDDKAHDRTDANKANEDLDFQTTSKSMSGDHESASNTDEVEEKCSISEDAMNDDPAVSNKGSELEDSE